MKIIKFSFAVIAALGLATSAQASLKNEKITLAPNMVVSYNKLPSSVDTFTEVLSEGMFYGRLRSNMFIYDWKDDSSNEDNKAMGIGGSFIYKTAPFKGVSATLGLYTSQNPQWFNENEEDAEIVKSGKDTFSRRDAILKGDYGMSVLGQAFIRYDVAKTSIVAGRQLFESVYTKANDTKMIPNTFDGISATVKEINKTTIRVAWFTSQKLRDHTLSHDILAYDPDDKWYQNDDSAVNKNLTVEKIGDDNELIIASITNRSIKNLKTNVSYAIVPDVFSNITFEAHYTIPVLNKWKIIPGMRYMKQFDDLGAEYDVASYSGSDVTGYNNPKSLDSGMIAARVDFKKGPFLGRLGYSKVEDKADLIAPWRGFPTSGFTRTMAQYNWRANTKTYMAKIGYDFGIADLIPGFSVTARYAIQDFDDKKDDVQADSNVIHVDAIQNIDNNLQAKLRFGFADVDDSTLKSNGVDYKSDISYSEYRFEINYFF